MGYRILRKVDRTNTAQSARPRYSGELLGGNVSSRNLRGKKQRTGDWVVAYPGLDKRRKATGERRGTGCWGNQGVKRCQEGKEKIHKDKL